MPLCRACNAHRLCCPSCCPPISLLRHVSHAFPCSARGFGSFASTGLHKYGSTRREFSLVLHARAACLMHDIKTHNVMPSSEIRLGAGPPNGCALFTTDRIISHGRCTGESRDNQLLFAGCAHARQWREGPVAFRMMSASPPRPGAWWYSGWGVGARQCENRTAQLLACRGGGALGLLGLWQAFVSSALWTRFPGRLGAPGSPPRGARVCVTPSGAYLSQDCVFRLCTWSTTCEPAFFGRLLVRVCVPLQELWGVPGIVLQPLGNS